MYMYSPPDDRYCEGCQGPCQLGKDDEDEMMNAKNVVTVERVNRLWILFFTMLFLWPAGLTTTLMLVTRDDVMHWYEPATVSYLVLWGIFTIVLLVSVSESPLIKKVERPLTSVEKAQRDLDKQYPGT